MTNKPKISVIMPVYNAEKFVAKAIESILGQSYKDFEFIIINDASTDNSSEIIRSYADKDVRIRHFSNEQNLNIAATRNRGVEFATGDYIVTMDADDIAHENRLSNQLKYLENNPEVSISIGNIVVIDENSNEQYHRIYPNTDTELKKKVFRYNPFPNPTIMCRREVYVKTGKYDNKYVPIDDFDFWLRAGTNFHFGNCGKTVLFYRIVKNSASHGKLKYTEKLTFKLRYKAVNLGYKLCTFDIVYNLIHFVVYFVLPVNCKIQIFNIMRKRNILG